MKNRWKTLAKTFLLLMFLGSCLMILRQCAEYADRTASHDKALKLVGTTLVQELPEPALPMEEMSGESEVDVTPSQSDSELVPEYSPAPAPCEEEVSKSAELAWQEAPVFDDLWMDALQETNLAALREVNPDVRGWILIPGTKLNYPIVQGTDNDYYLNHTWDGISNSGGSVFLECRVSGDFSDFNTIIYGHRMMDGSMFGSLKYYRGQEYYREHPYIYLVDDGGVHRYEVFAAHEADVTSSTYYLVFTDERKTAFIDDALTHSVIDTGVTPGCNDRILTLSTCTGRGYESRWVVQARLAADGETPG